MKAYIGTKIIKAKEMSEYEFINKIKNEDIPKDKENRPGYLVVYDNDYKSWSPKEVFEAAYREISENEYALLKL